MEISRRDAFGLALAGTAALATEPAAAAAPGSAVLPAVFWRRGFDNQRVPDQGDGRFLNPLLSGDHPDPSILKDGADY
ncbi:hypothetical protein [Sphingomonas sp. RB3P16]|uniref:hypothetical protein n=1 Tax=Parasphingomonas frigoris TaxID=3096163 RepID=UPI003FA7B86F